MWPDLLVYMLLTAVRHYNNSSDRDLWSTEFKIVIWSFKKTLVVF